jgi:hypothetical protein
MIHQVMNHPSTEASISTRKTAKVSVFTSGSTINSVQGVRGVALMSAIEGPRKPRSRSAASLSFVESGSHGDVGSESGGFGVILNIVKLLVRK